MHAVAAGSRLQGQPGATHGAVLVACRACLESQAAPAVLIRLPAHRQDQEPLPFPTRACPSLRRRIAGRAHEYTARHLDSAAARGGGVVPATGNRCLPRQMNKNWREPAGRVAPLTHREAQSPAAPHVQPGVRSSTAAKDAGNAVRRSERFHRQLLKPRKTSGPDPAVLTDQAAAAQSPPHTCCAKRTSKPSKYTAPAPTRHPIHEGRPGAVASASGLRGRASRGDRLQRAARARSSSACGFDGRPKAIAAEVHTRLMAHSHGAVPAWTAGTSPSLSHNHPARQRPLGLISPRSRAN